MHSVSEVMHSVSEVLHSVGEVLHSVSEVRGAQPHALRCKATWQFAPAAGRPAAPSQAALQSSACHLCLFFEGRPCACGTCPNCYNCVVGERGVTYVSRCSCAISNPNESRSMSEAASLSPSVGRKVKVAYTLATGPLPGSSHVTDSGSPVHSLLMPTCHTGGNTRERAQQRQFHTSAPPNSEFLRLDRWPTRCGW